MTNGARLMANALLFKPAFVAPTLSASVSSVLSTRFVCLFYLLICLTLFLFVFSAVIVGTVLSKGETTITEQGVLCSRALVDSTPTIEEVGTNSVFKTLSSSTVQSGL